MDEKFLAAYNEVVLDNFNAVLKQNFMFQTQIRFHEEAVKELGELREKLAQSTSSSNEVEELKNKVESYKTQLSSKDAIIRSNSASNLEKDRLQKAVNDQAKEIASLKEQLKTIEEKESSTKDTEQKHLDKIKELEEEIQELKSYKVNLDDLKKEQTSSKKSKKKETGEEQSLFAVSATGGTF